MSRDEGNGEEQPSGGRQLHGIGIVVLCTWAAVASLVLGTLMVGHWYALPAPANAQRPQVAAAIAALRPANKSDQWFAVHVLFAECRCSQRIFEHLFTRQRPAQLAEHVLLVGDHEEYIGRARKAGFGLTLVKPAALKARFHIEAAPLLLVARPDGGLGYVGGYTARKQGLEIQDMEIIADLQRHQAVDELPPFGCAVSRALQELLDPLGIKYNASEE